LPPLPVNTDAGMRILFVIVAFPWPSPLAMAFYPLPEQSTSAGSATPQAEASPNDNRWPAKCSPTTLRLLSPGMGGRAGGQGVRSCRNPSAANEYIIERNQGRARWGAMPAFGAVFQRRPDHRDPGLHPGGWMIRSVFHKRKACPGRDPGWRPVFASGKTRQMKNPEPRFSISIETEKSSGHGVAKLRGGDPPKSRRGNPRYRPRPIRGGHLSACCCSGGACGQMAPPRLGNHHRARGVDAPAPNPKRAAVRPAKDRTGAGISRSSFGEKNCPAASVSS